MNVPIENIFNLCTININIFYFQFTIEHKHNLWI